jgi:hypothetical protein
MTLELDETNQTRSRHSGRCREPCLAKGPTAVRSQWASRDQPYNEHIESSRSSHVVLVADGSPVSVGSGALDSACNRTVVGFRWLQEYLSFLQTEGLAQLASWEPEVEFFRFGNGGRLKSDRRYALRICVESKPLFVKVSVVASPTLGALLGKDFIKALGIVLDFEHDVFSSSVLGVRNVHLDELQAGHYCLPLRNRLVELWHEPLSVRTWLCLGGVVGLGCQSKSEAGKSLTPGLARNRAVKWKHSLFQAAETAEESKFP